MITKKLFTIYSNEVHALVLDTFKKCSFPTMEFYRGKVILNIGGDITYKTVVLPAHEVKDFNSLIFRLKGLVDIMQPDLKIDFCVTYDENAINVHGLTSVKLQFDITPIKGKYA